MAQLNIKQVKGATQGSVLFLDTNGVVSENNNRLFWSNSNSALIIGTNSLFGTEKLRLIGDQRIEGNLVVTGSFSVPGVFLVRGDGNVGIGASNPQVSLQIGTSFDTKQLQINGGGGFDETFTVQAHKVSGYLYTFYNRDYSRYFAIYYQDGQGAGTNARVQIMDGTLGVYHVNNTNYRIGFGSHFEGDSYLLSSRHSMGATGTDGLFAWSDTYNEIVIDSVKGTGFTEPFLRFRGGDGISPTKIGTFRLHTTLDSWVAVSELGTVGNFGVGTSNPTAKLHVRGGGANSSTNSLYITNNNSLQALTVRDDLFTLSRRMILDKSANYNDGGLASQDVTMLVLTSNQTSINNFQSLSLIFKPQNNSVNTFSGINFRSLNNSFGSVFGVHHVGDIFNDFVWWGNDGTNEVENMRLKNNGRLGIGTNNPTAKLHISATQSGTGFRLTDTSQENGFILKTDANGFGSWQPENRYVYIGSVTFQDINQNVGFSSFTLQGVVSEYDGPIISIAVKLQSSFTVDSDISVGIIDDNSNQAIYTDISDLSTNFIRSFSPPPSTNFTQLSNFSIYVSSNGIVFNGGNSQGEVFLYILFGKIA
jgi:hypothetical protein